MNSLETRPPHWHNFYTSEVVGKIVDGLQINRTVLRRSREGQHGDSKTGQAVRILAQLLATRSTIGCNLIHNLGCRSGKPGE
jgi:hypothetical protein